MNENNYRSDAESGNEGMHTSNKSKQKLRNEAHSYEKKIQELLEKIDILESRMKIITDQKLKIVSKLKSLEEENEMLKDQFDRQASYTKKLTDDNAKLAAKIENLMNTNKILNEKCKTKFEILNKELDEKNSGIEKLLSQIKAKDDTIKYYSVNNEQTIRSQTMCQEELESVKKVNKSLNEKISSLEKTIDELYVNKKSEGALSLEIEHLKDDNVRLLKMLKTTEEFKDFASLAERVPGGVRFIKESEIKARPKSSIRDCEKKNLAKWNSANAENWVPNEAYSFTMDFKSRYNVDMNEELINDLLSSLNKIWRERENKLLKDIKGKYQSEIMTLKRRLVMKTPFDQLTAGKTISKLKRDLKQTREDLRTNMVMTNKLKSSPSGIDLVDNALKVASTFQQTKNCLEHEISSLKKKLNEKEDKSSKENCEHLQLKEHQWIIQKVTEEVEDFENHIDDLHKEYEDRVKNVNLLSGSSDMMEFNLKLINNSMKWFYTSMKHMISDLKEKFTQWNLE